MTSENDSRRTFVRTTGTVAAAGMLVLQPELVRGSQNNSALTVGVIGVGNRGSFVAGLFAKNEFARIAAVCDIYEDRIKEATAKFSGAKVFRDHRELLASDVDAVLIATPAYLHPEHFEAAVKSRKHIFLEKPAGVDAKGCLRVMAAGKKADPTKRISVDYQQRYGKDYRRAYELVKSGELGAIKMVRAAWLGNGPAVRTGHDPKEEKVRNWYFYRDMSGDIIVEQDCHNLDVVNWFMNTHPVKAAGYGSQAVRKYGDVVDNLGVTYHFADGTVFSYSASQMPGVVYQDISETFLCEKGSVQTSRRGYKVWRGDRRNQPPEEVTTSYDITADAVNEFVEGARTGKIENMAQVAAESTLTAILGREAIYSGREMTWDRMTKA